jgi:two-component system uhpT operon response regulator UhpA
VVLVDDHVVVRSGFAQLLSLEEDLEVVGQFSSAAEAWPALLRDDVDVAVMDIAMPDENGLSLLKRLRAQKRFSRHYSQHLRHPRLCRARWMPAPAAI